MTISCIKVSLPYDVFGPDDLDQVKIRIRGEESIVRFKQLISRALNTFADAHPELKELGDILEYGKPLQDYYAQRSDKQNAKPIPPNFSTHPYGTDNPE